MRRRQHVLLPGLMLVAAILLGVGTTLAQQWKPEVDRQAGLPLKIEWLVNEVKTKTLTPETQLAMLEYALQLAEQSQVDSLLAKVYNQLANFDKKNGDLNNAWIDFQFAKIYYIKGGKYNQVSSIIYLQGQILLFQNLTDSCRKFLNRSSYLLSLSTDEKMKLYVKSLYAIAFMKENKKETALAVFSNLLPIAEAMHDTQMIISTYINLGMLQENFDSSLFWYSKGMVYARERSPAKYVELLVKIGNLYAARDDGKRDSALYIMLEAERNIENFSDPVFKVQLYNFLGHYFYTRHESTHALAYFHKGYALSKGLMGKHRNVIINNLALTYAKLGKPDSGLYYLNIYREAIKNSKDEYEFLLLHQTWAVNLAARGDSCSMEVIQHNSKALEHAVNLSDAHLGSDLLIQTANCLLNRPADAKARALADTLLLHCAFFYEILNKENTKGWMTEVLENYAALEAKFGNRDKALALYKVLTARLNEMHSEEYFKGMDESLVKYKSDLKDSRIALLTEQEKASQVQNRLIVVCMVAVALISILIFVFYTRELKSGRLLDERNRKVEQLLREVHHRVKNNLQIVSSFINIQLEKVKDSSSRQALLDTSSRILALAGLHQSLYRQDDLSGIQIDEYIRDLCMQLGTNIGTNIKIECELDALQLDIDQAIPVGLAVNELITNSLKHAFKDDHGGLIIVKLSAGKNWELIVRDNGKGLPPDLNPAELSSIGMRLVQDITETQLHGECHFYNDGGAVCRINFVPVA